MMYSIYMQYTMVMLYIKNVFHMHTVGMTAEYDFKGTHKQENIIIIEKCYSFALILRLIILQWFICCYQIWVM